jgi:CubicO group peptidase (beta-lactamase class C family)
MTVAGWTAPGFERVRDVLAGANLDDGGGAFAAYVAGERVVDLWTGQADADEPWQEQTVAGTYSSTKALVTGCLVVLHHDGLVELDKPVADHWPEFAVAGKERVTVRQLLAHSAGLVEVPGYQGFLGVHGENWDQREEIRVRLAAAQPAWEPGEAHAYHGLTFGYLAGALVERVSGLPLTEFFRTRLAEPWGLDLHFGLTAETDGRRARQLPQAPLPPEQEAVAEAVRAVARDPDTLLGKAFWAQDGTTVLEHLAASGNDPVRMGCGAGNGDVVGSARALAQFFVHLARGPLADSTRAFAEVHRRGPDLALGVPATWCVGFQGNDVSAFGGLAMGPGERTFGHGGAGGQLAGYDPERELAFGFVRNQLSPVSPAAHDLLYATCEALLTR